MRYAIHTLPNGLRIVLAKLPQTKTASVFVMTGTGSRYETKQENGLAHFLEHMFFKGTKKRPSARAISEELDGVGAVYNAFTAKDRTAYYAKVDSRYLPVALDVISDIYLHSTLPGKEIAKERGAVIQEIDMYADIPMRSVDDLFDELRFGNNHPLGRTVLGPKENIRAFARKDFASYLARHYTPESAVVCVAGAFSEKAVLDKIKREFGKLKKADRIDPIPFTGVQEAPRVSIKEKKTDQTQLMLGTPAYPYLHKDEYALEVLAAALGGGMSSRLFLEVREKRGLAYSVHAWTDKYTDAGSFVVQAGVEHGKLEKVIATILAEFRKVKRGGIGAAELAKTKSYLKGTLTLSLETSDRVAEHAASSLIHFGKIRTLEEMLRGIDRVSAADVRRVANDLFTTNALNLAVIGPHQEAAKFQALLRL